jgi:SOS-response transcriptional repressor LexA
MIRDTIQELDEFFDRLLGGLVLFPGGQNAEEELSDTMDLDEFLIKNKEATYVLKVTGDSMRDAGILPGDMVLVERGLEPHDGDIVIAHIDHAWTMKYLRKRGRKIWLEPANKRYRPLFPKEELKIAAVVIAVIRKYHDE